ncbi:hypothetical protein [uncultured Pseudokineococcus sp.]|uniref:hypothetical protein n=1 Tax=uncultured Pseudokineococcus sp. TaxID=1642928 RepID=UPI00261347B3|nr:hypothetical protein [uncultured Pseudokineococcus sp.]
MRRREVPEEVARLARAQAGCVARAQLRAHGLGPDVVRRRVGAGLWRALGPHVVVLHAGPLDVGARRAAAVLHAGPSAALGAWTALAVHGLGGWERADAHLVLPPGRSRGPLEGAVHHVSRRCRAEDVVVRDGLRVHRVERAAVDAAAWSPSGRAAGGLLAAVVQQRLSTPARLRTALDAAGGLRGVAELRAVLDDLDGGSQAMSEVDLVRLCRRNGLPVPVRQGVRHDAAGRRRYLDAEWELADGRRVLLEVDGVGHLDPARWYDDLLRAAEVSRPGEVVLRLPARALRTDGARVVALLRAHLAPDPSCPSGPARRR